MTMHPTTEQASALSLFAKAQILKINTYVGIGKIATTPTCVGMTNPVFREVSKYYSFLRKYFIFFA
ncbi:hypothetical protein CCP4SC76_5320002 [Gammaproteobacteria bacterium]